MEIAIGALVALAVFYVLDFLGSNKYDSNLAELAKKAAEEKRKRIEAEFEKLYKEIEDAKAEYSDAKRKLNEPTDPSE